MSISVVTLKECPIRLSVKVAEQDKRKMYESTRAPNDVEPSKSKSTNDVLVDVEEVGADSLPVLQHEQDSTDEDGWITLNEPILFL